MRTYSTSRFRSRAVAVEPAAGDLLAALTVRVIGQDSALESIVPYIQMYQAGLAPEGRPVGVFLLLGPTGTGKTRTVEALAEALHGSERNHLRIDCGEFQMEHEVAKLIGAPPGYLGHRETVPMINQAKLNMVSSDRSSLSIVLFDEIEKAAPSLQRLLLGVLDKGSLRLGDNTSVNFERSLIFLTSNLGARSMNRQIRPDWGFERLIERAPIDIKSKLEKIALSSVRRKFSPEFVNRIDVISTYVPLDRETLDRILDHQVDQIRRHISARLGIRAFHLEVTKRARRFLLDQGTSAEFGARELRRTVQRQLTQPLAALMARGELEPGGLAWADHLPGETRLSFACASSAEANLEAA